MLAGIDVSGDPASGNHKFMAIVIGTDESISALTRRLGPEPVHMNMIRSRYAKDSIINKVSFDGRNRIGLCIRLEKKHIVLKIRDRLKHRRGFANKKKLFRAYNALVWRMVRDPVEKFLRLHDYEIHKLYFQCDIDCSDFVHDQGWRSTKPGSAHALADVLAWGNSHGKEPDGAVYLDRSDLLEERMARLFK